MADNRYHDADMNYARYVEKAYRGYPFHLFYQKGRDFRV